ncbi:MAG: hypothetical protein ABIV04_04575 [Massilia sp.]
MNGEITVCNAIAAATGARVGVLPMSKAGFTIAWPAHSPLS